MIHKKLTKEELEELRRHEPTKIISSYEEYERRYEEIVKRHRECAITLAELDARIASKLLPEN